MTDASGPPVVVVGESLVDIVVSPSGETTEAVGGSPMNVAVGLARLDVPALLVTRIGDDARGRRVAEHVRASGARLADSSVEPGGTTSTATARLSADGAAGYDFDLAWTLPRQRLPETEALHVGSLGASLEPGRQATVDLVRQAADADAFVSYDPNVRPAFLTDVATALRDLEETAGLSSLVKASDEDLTLLRPGRSPEEVASGLLRGERTELVLVTRGAQGASAFCDGVAVHVPAPVVDLVDTVGAGDSFMAATLAVLHGWGLLAAGSGRLRSLDEQRLRILLGAAMAAAAITCSRRGADPPTRDELPVSWPAP